MTTGTIQNGAGCKTTETYLFTQNQTISLSSLAELTGFPEEYIKSELFKDSDSSPDDLSMEELRSVMVNYLNRTMMDET